MSEPTERSAAWQAGYESAAQTCPNPACRAQHDGSKADRAQHYAAEVYAARKPPSERDYWATAQADPILAPLLEAGIVSEPTGTKIADSDRIVREAEHVFDVRGWQPGTTEGERP